eukprot:898592-Amphidinium_carterae.1
MIEILHALCTCMQEQFLPGLNGATRPPCLSVDVLDDYSCPSRDAATPALQSQQNPVRTPGFGFTL